MNVLLEQIGTTIRQEVIDILVKAQEHMLQISKTYIIKLICFDAQLQHQRCGTVCCLERCQDAVDGRLKLGSLVFGVCDCGVNADIVKKGLVVFRAVDER